MYEIQQIVAAYNQIDFRVQKAVLATLVSVQGSAYRRAGARMLVTDDGRMTGAISGGCLEGDALRKAQLVMTTGVPLLVTYDTTDEDDGGLGIGLGCNGIIQVLMEPVHPGNEKNPLQLLTALVSSRQQGVLVTHYSLQHRRLAYAGTTLLLREDGTTLYNTNNAALQPTLLAFAQRAMETKHAFTADVQNTNDTLLVFTEWLRPPVHMVVAGAGNDVLPLVRMAKILGWRVTVADGRNNYATAARFPEADEVVVSRPEHLLNHIRIDAQTVFVLMTHNYHYDFAVLRMLLQQPIAYTGVLGPRKKLMRMLDDLQKEGIELTKEQASRIYGPTGLDIGAETPEEIALSILAEIQSVISNGSAMSLREKPLGIHARTNVAPDDSGTITPVDCPTFLSPANPPDRHLSG